MTDLSVYRPNWSPERQTSEIEPGAAYGLIQCVAAKEIPQRASVSVRMPYGTWSSLTEEIMLRLEQTPRREALRIPFVNAALARRASTSIGNTVNRQHGEGVIETYLRDDTLYIRRGKQWGKESDSGLAALTK